MLANDLPDAVGLISENLDLSVFQNSLKHVGYRTSALWVQVPVIIGPLGGLCNHWHSQAEEGPGWRTRPGARPRPYPLRYFSV